MAGNLLELCFHNKKIMKLNVKSGDFKVKEWDKEKKQKVETGDLKPGKVQTFSISLGMRGRQPLGYINVQYWGDKELVEGKVIRKGYFFLKQNKGKNKNPTTFVETAHSNHTLVLIDFDCLIDEQTNKKYDKVKNLTPEQSIQQGLNEYQQGMKDDYEMEHFGDTIIDNTQDMPLDKTLFKED